MKGLLVYISFLLRNRGPSDYMRFIILILAEGSPTSGPEVTPIIFSNIVKLGIEIV